MSKLYRVGVLFKQFGVVNAIGFMISETIRTLFDSYATPSYSQTGEDRIIRSILGNSKGFYVDVGCNHPLSLSNTFELYKRGWVGINIDANSALISKYTKRRPKDKSICAAVSSKEEEAIFTQFDDDAVSSLCSQHVATWEKERVIVSQKTVKTLTLDRILKSYEAPHAFDLLTIDAEGHDFEVLSSINLSIYKPKLIVIEMHGFEILNPNENKIYQYLSANSYKMVGFIIMNGFFVRQS